MTPFDHQFPFKADTSLMEERVLSLTCNSNCQAVIRTTYRSPSTGEEVHLDHSIYEFIAEAEPDDLMPFVNLLPNLVAMAGQKKKDDDQLFNRLLTAI